MNMEMDGGIRQQRSNSGASKRGRTDEEDFGRDSFAGNDNDDNGCSSSATGGSGAGAGSAAASVSRAKYGKEATVGGDDKAELIRRRNCENARKARARKKMEVNQLEDQVSKLKELHARTRLEAIKAKELDNRMGVLRRQTLRRFMNYRCSNVKNYQQWAEIVDERFTMTLPITPYRWFNGHDVFNNSRVLRGIKHLISDNGSLAILIESLGCGSFPWRQEMEKGRGHGVELVCDLSESDILITQNTAMCSFVLRTTNAVKHGAKRDWVCRGMLSAKFSPGSAKLLAVEHVFDVTSLMQQLQKVIGDVKNMPIVPNTPGGACQPSSEARVIMTATPPFTIVYCNESWTKLCGYPQGAVQGQDLDVIRGPCTDAAAMAALKKDLQQGRAASSLLFNYKRDGSKFLNYLRVYPLVGDARGTITHFLGVLQEQAEPDPGGSKQPHRETKQQQQQQQQQQRQADTGAIAPTVDAGGGGGGTGVQMAESSLPSSTINPWRGRYMGTPRLNSGGGAPAGAATIPTSMASVGGSGGGGGEGRRDGRRMSDTSATSVLWSSFMRASSGARAASNAKEKPTDQGGGRGARGDRRARQQQQQQQQQQLHSSGISAHTIGTGQQQQQHRHPEGPAMPVSSSKMKRFSQPMLTRRQQQQQQQRQQQPNMGHDGSCEEKEKERCTAAKTLSLSPDLDEEAATGAFLAWEDVLAGPSLGHDGDLGEFNAQADDLVGLEDLDEVMKAIPMPNASGAANRGPEGLGDSCDRTRAHSDPALGTLSCGVGDLDRSWRAAIGDGGGGANSGNGRDLITLRQDPTGVANRLSQGGARGVGGGGGSGSGLRQEGAPQVRKMDERGARSVSDSSGWRLPSPQFGLAAENTLRDTLLPPSSLGGGLFMGSDTMLGSAAVGSGELLAGAGAATSEVTQQVLQEGTLSAAATAAATALEGGSRHARSSETTGSAGEASTDSLGGLAMLSDIDVSDLLLTQEELFRPLATATGGTGDAGASTGGPSIGAVANSVLGGGENMQTLDMFNPAVLKSILGGGGVYGSTDGTTLGNDNGNGNAGGGGSESGSSFAGLGYPTADSATGMMGGLDCWTSVMSSRGLAGEAGKGIGLPPGAPAVGAGGSGRTGGTGAGTLRDPPQAHSGGNAIDEEPGGGDL